MSDVRVRSTHNDPIRFGGPEGAANYTGPEDVFQAFSMYVGKVWVHENNVPTSGPSLATFDILSIKPAWDEFRSSNRRLDYSRGLTLYENWLLNQLTMHTEMVCVIGSDVPHAGLESITRKAFLPRVEIVSVLQDILPTHPAAASVKSRYAQGMVYHGSDGHAVTFYAKIQESDHLVYFDPWPGPSLLLDWVQTEGAVHPTAGPERLWEISAHSLTGLLYAVVLERATWDWIHGIEEDAKLEPSPEGLAEPTEAQREEALEFAGMCLSRGYLTTDGVADINTMLNRGALFGKDRWGQTSLHHLKELVAKAEREGWDVTPVLTKAVRLGADPSSLVQG
jgi:hypothetical protein